MAAQYTPLAGGVQRQEFHLRLKLVGLLNQVVKQYAIRLQPCRILRHHTRQCDTGRWPAWPDVGQGFQAADQHNGPTRLTRVGCDAGGILGTEPPGQQHLTGSLLPSGCAEPPHTARLDRSGASLKTKRRRDERRDGVTVDRPLPQGFRINLDRDLLRARNEEPRRVGVGNLEHILDMPRRAARTAHA